MLKDKFFELIMLHIYDSDVKAVVVWVQHLLHFWSILTNILYNKIKHLLFASKVSWESLYVIASYLTSTRSLKRVSQ